MLSYTTTMNDIEPEWTEITGQAFGNIRTGESDRGAVNENWMACI